MLRGCFVCKDILQDNKFNSTAVFGDFPCIGLVILGQGHPVYLHTDTFSRTPHGVSSGEFLNTELNGCSSVVGDIRGCRNTQL